MIKSNANIFSAACGLLLLAACTGSGDKGTRAPIVLGDTATIITETDPRYTKDLVADLHPNIPTKTHHDEDEAAPAAADTSKDAQPAKPGVTMPTKQQAQAAGGLTIAFKEVSVSLPDITVKSYHTQDPLKSNGVSYQLVSGTIPNSRIVINSGTVLKVSQRYQSQLVVNGTDADLVLDNLNTTSDWVPIPNNRNTYTAKGLEVVKLQAPTFNANTLRNAITRASRRHRISRKREQEYQASVRNVHKADGRPLTVSLRSVMWKIDGKDAAGKQFSKQVRVDLP